MILLKTFREITMPLHENHLDRDRKLKRMAGSIMLGWLLLISGSLAWNQHHAKTTIMTVVLEQARLSYDKDLVYRRWAASHGGVYVPPTDQTLPNPFLAHLPNRDVVTIQGEPLTLMNPAYMTRQVHELGKEQYGLKAHITSLDPLRPENAPDGWERKALEAFLKGEKEVSAIETLEGKPHFRLIRPMVTEKACLKCHGSQGRKEGDISGGLSVSIPLSPHLSLMHRQWLSLCIAHFLIGILGFFGLSAGYASLRRHQAELTRIIQRYELVVEGSSGAVWDWDIKEKKVYFSQNWKTIRGYENHEIGEHEDEWKKRIHPDDLPRVSAAVQEHLEGSTPIFSLEYRTCHKDGSWIWISDQGKAILDSSGQPLRMAGSELDITTRKLNETALKESEERFSSIFLQSPIAIEIYDSSGRLLGVNPAALDLFGVDDKKEVLDFDLFSDPNLPGRLKQKLLNGETIAYQAPFDFNKVREAGLYRTSRQGIIFIDVLISPLNNRSIQGYLVQVQDISAQKKSEKELRESNARWQFALEGSGDGVWDWDLDTGHVFFSKQWKAMLGYNENDIENSQDEWDRLIHPEDLAQARNTLQRHLKAKSQLYRAEFRMRCCDGTYKWILARGKIIERKADGTAKRMIGTHADISERKQFEYEREELIRQLTKTLDEVRTLSGLLPICSVCKRIRDDHGYWKQIETYIKAHSDCTARYYPDLKIS